MTSRTPWPLMFGAALAVAGLLGLSACSDTDDGDGVASADDDENPAGSAETEDTTPPDEDAQALVFAGCMRDNGVKMPDPGPGQQGLVDAFQAVSEDYDGATLEQALAACEDLMPQYAQGDMHDDDTMLALAECLREQGLDVSDDPFGDVQRGEIDHSELTPALEECRSVLTGGDE